MFTGLVEEIGRIESVDRRGQAARLRIQANKVLEKAQLGDSIATNGVCLTVTEKTSKSFTVDVMAETMRKSNLHLLRRGDEVNLERALLVGDRLGGHIVSGHIDGMGTIKKYEKEDNAIWITVETSPELLRYVILKGSIAIDGVSLTVGDVREEDFSVSIIPHTQNATTLIRKQVGDKVNLECDIIGKYIEKLLGVNTLESRSKGMDRNFLMEHGFI